MVSERLPAVTDALATAGVVVRPIAVGTTVEAIAHELLDTARGSGGATWVVRDGDAPSAEQAASALRDVAVTDASIDVQLIQGSWDLPGARLLDVVTTMDRLRSPGGCPWDAEQTHETLAPYLLEEAYEAFQAIEDGDNTGLREELGDVLLQIAFHSRIAAELPAEQRWTVDDVATGLVEKLVRRHPHVFEGLAVSGADEVNANWEAIKAAERGERSVLANVPLAAPALTLAATLQRKAAREDPDAVGCIDLAAAIESYTQAPSTDTAGELLWTLVASARGQNIDAEAALRKKARVFRDGFAAGSGPIEPPTTRTE